MKHLIVGLVVALALAACGSAAGDNPTATVAPTTTAAPTSTAAPTTTIAPTTTVASTTAPPQATVADIGRQFTDMLNARDVGAVAAMAPSATEFMRDFIIGGGPYDSVDCYMFNGMDECHVVHEIADFTFGVDVASGLVTDITYVGGE